MASHLGIEGFNFREDLIPDVVVPSDSSHSWSSFLRNTADKVVDLFHVPELADLEASQASPKATACSVEDLRDKRGIGTNVCKGDLFGT